MIYIHQDTSIGAALLSIEEIPSQLILTGKAIIFLIARIKKTNNEFTLFDDKKKVSPKWTHFQQFLFRLLLLGKIFIVSSIV